MGAIYGISLIVIALLVISLVVVAACQGIGDALQSNSSYHPERNTQARAGDSTGINHPWKEINK